MELDQRYWCPLWYPARRGEGPCANFFVAGTYVGHVDAQGDPTEFLWEGDPDHVECTAHDIEPEQVSLAIWTARITSAHALAAARGYAIPAPEAWRDPYVLGPVVGPAGGQCHVPGAYGYGENCGRTLLRVAFERAARIYEKLVCPTLVEGAARGYGLPADLERTAHANECLPWLPRNW